MPSCEDYISLWFWKTAQEKRTHCIYMKEFRVEKCQLFQRNKCSKVKPFTCFYWHFLNQRRRRPVKRKDGTFNYSPNIYCRNYNENTGVCPNGDECSYLHRTAGDSERLYHVRFYKTVLCDIYASEGTRGHCFNEKNCAFAHGLDDLRNPIYDIKELHTIDINEEGANAVAGPSNLGRKTRDKKIYPGFGAIRNSAAFSSQINFISGGSLPEGAKTKKKESDEIIILSDDDESEPAPKKSFLMDRSRSRGTSLQTQKNNEFGTWVKYSSGFGKKMLMKMGYKSGKGLGKTLQGIKTPIETKSRLGRGSLGLYGLENSTIACASGGQREMCKEAEEIRITNQKLIFNQECQKNNGGQRPHSPPMLTSAELPITVAPKEKRVKHKRKHGCGSNHRSSGSDSRPSPYQ